MSEFKTRAYDHIKLYGPKVLSLKEMPLPDHIDHPYVNVSRERLKTWGDDYKIMFEFVAEVLGKEDFTQWDIVNWYRKRAAELEAKARKI